MENFIFCAVELKSDFVRHGVGQELVSMLQTLIIWFNCSNNSGAIYV